MIGFSGNFNFTEGDAPTMLELTIDRIIYQDISITIAGGNKHCLHFQEYHY